jgi:hypothetical protein
MMKLQERITMNTKTWMEDFVISMSGSLAETNKKFEQRQAHLFSANADFLQYQLELDRMLEHSDRLKTSVRNGPNEINLQDDGEESSGAIVLHKRDVISSLASIEDSVQKAISKAAPLSEVIQRSREMCNKVNRDLISYKKSLNRWTINNAMGDYLLESPDSAAMSGVFAAGDIGMGIYSTEDLAMTGAYITDLEGVAESFVGGIGKVAEFFA